MFIQEEDDEPRVRMGRFNDADEHIIQGIMGKTWWGKKTSRRSNPQRKALRISLHERDFGLVRRAYVIAQNYNTVARKEAVVAIKSTPKRRSGVENVLRYITRTRREDERENRHAAMPAWDGFHEPISPEDIERVLEAWGLLSDADNLSKKARQYLKTGDTQVVEGMGEKKRYHHIQARHYVFSIEEDGQDEKIENKFRSAVYMTVDDVFAASGHRSIWAIHRDDTDHLHAHVVVRALSDFGGRLRSDIRGDFLHRVRNSFSEHLQSVGLDYTATRKIDRRRDRESIMAGQAVLREHSAPWLASHGMDGAYGNLEHWPSVFGESAVQNIKRVEAAKAVVCEQTSGLDKEPSAAMVAQTLRSLLDEPPGKTAWLRGRFGKWFQGSQGSTVPDEYRELMDVLRKMYHDPVTALRSWQLMSLDGVYKDRLGRVQYRHRRLANWTLRHRPEYLGTVKADAYLHANDKTLKQILRKALPPRSMKFRPNANMVDVFFDHLRKKRIRKDRSKVMTDLRHLHKELERDWPEAWFVDVVDEAIRKTCRIKIGEFLPQVVRGSSRPTPIDQAPKLQSMERGSRARKQVRTARRTHTEDQELRAQPSRNRPLERKREGVSRR